MRKLRDFTRTGAAMLCAAAVSIANVSPVTAETEPEGAVTSTVTVQGFEGPITVEVVADANEIYSITVTDHDESIGLGAEAVQWLPPAMVESQKIDVDVYSGATTTSEALKEAVREALEAEGIDPSVFDGTASAGGQDTEEQSETETEEAEVLEEQELEADIVIVGAGGAGMTAAIEATDAGKNVILVESQQMVGGNSVRSTGGLNAAKTVWQDENEFNEAAGVEKQLAAAEENYADNEAIAELIDIVKRQWEEYQENPEGYFDSVELFELDTLIGGKGINDPELVAALCENSADAIDWLSSIGASLTNVSSFGGASVKRIHRPVNEEGKTLAVGSYIVPILQQNLEDRGVTILLNTTAEKILTGSNGQATGIVASGKAGETITIHAKAVILATGGFGANLDMVSELNPQLEGFMTTNAPGAQGQGIAMAQELGAATVDLDQIQIHPTVQVDTSALITEGLRGDGAILVNEEGKRFIDEVGTRDVVSAAEIAQTGSHSYLVVDQAMVDASSVIQGYITAGYTVSGETYEELAEAMSVDAQAFAQTMEEWNQCVENGEDPEFGRTSFAKPLDSAPYYAINVTAGIHHTMGGVKINANTEVLDTDGNVIPGLFAAGEVTGGVHGANRLGGNAVADFTVFGRIAGQNAAVYTDSDKE